MKTLETLEKRLEEIYKDKVDPKEIESLALLKNDIQAVKDEAKKTEDSLTEICEKYRDSILKAGSFPPTGKEGKEEEEDTPPTFEKVLADFLKKGKN